MRPAREPGRAGHLDDSPNKSAGSGTGFESSSSPTGSPSPARRDDGSVGVYIHIPFCDRVCPYCDFAVVAARPLEREAESRYVDALIAELALRESEFRGRRLASLYFGGGTPSLLHPESIARLIEATTSHFAPEAASSNFASAKSTIEITLEVNPSTTERQRLPAFRDAGINRLSIGIQSFDDAILKQLGRAHRADEGHRTLEAARAAGFENVSLDLIVAAPGQTLESLHADIDEAVAFAPEHLSAYELTIEPDTPFALANRRGQLACPEEDTATRMLTDLADRLAAVEIHQYEISNFARPGSEAIHNARYWSRQPVLGLGVGAWSNEAPCPHAPHGRRTANPRDLALYLERIESAQAATAEIDVLTAEQARGEAMFLGLRRTRGLRAEAFRLDFGAEPRHFFGPAIDRLMAAQLLAETQDGDLSLTARGRLLADSVFEEFV